MSRIGVLVVHGMGRQEAGFSSELKSAVVDRLADRAWRMEWHEVRWASILEPRETLLSDWMSKAKTPSGAPIRLDFSGIRQFVLHNLGDATAYQRDAHIESAGQLIHQRVSSEIEALVETLGDPLAPIVVIAHSLGAHIMSNYIWDRQQNTQPPGQPLAGLPGLAGMITFGCNIPLFALAFRSARPINLPGEAVSSFAVARAVRWLNFLDQDDVLGWPIRGLYEKDLADLTPAQKQTVERIEDYEIKVGGLFTGGTPLSHDGYWKDRGLATQVADYLKNLLAALEETEQGHRPPVQR
jgi:hypothetical protein